MGILLSCFFANDNPHSKSHNKIHHSDSYIAQKDLKFFKKRDMALAKPMFQALGLEKKIQNKLYKVYESVCDGGKGSLHTLCDEMIINQCDRPFFGRTFQYFHPNHKTFTFPQFVMCTWNFLSLQSRGLGEWTFRAYFGGAACNPHKHATEKEVFHMMDIIYGISKEMDYNPHSEYREQQMHTGNSHEYDVKRAHNMVKGLANQDGELGVTEFVELTKKSPALLSRAFAVQVKMRTDLCGIKYWEKKARARDEVADFDRTILLLKKTTPTIFDMVQPREGEETPKDAEERKKLHDQHMEAVKHVREGHGVGSHQKYKNHSPHSNFHGAHEHRTKMAGYNKNKQQQHQSKYVAKVEHPEYTGSVHAEDHHHDAASKIQKILSRGHRGREKMRGHRAKKTGMMVSKNWHEAYDPKKDKKYWHNTLPGENTWHQPDNL